MSTAIQDHLRVFRDGQNRWARRASLLALLRHTFGHSTQAADPNAHFPLWLCVGRAEADALGSQLARRISREPEDSNILATLKQAPLSTWAAEIWTWVPDGAPEIYAPVAEIVEALAFPPTRDSFYHLETANDVTVIRPDPSGQGLDEAALEAAVPYLYSDSMGSLTLLGRGSVSSVESLFKTDEARAAIAALPSTPTYLVAGTFRYQDIAYACIICHTDAYIKEEHVVRQLVRASAKHNITPTEWLRVVEGIFETEDQNLFQEVYQGISAIWNLRYPIGKAWKMQGYFLPRVRRLPFLVLFQLFQEGRVVAADALEATVTLPTLAEWIALSERGDDVAAVKLAIPRDLAIAPRDKGPHSQVLALYSADPAILSHQPQELDARGQVIPWIQPPPTWANVDEYRVIPYLGIRDIVKGSWAYSFEVDGMPLPIYPVYLGDTQDAVAAPDATWNDIRLEVPVLRRSAAGVIVRLTEPNARNLDVDLESARARAEYDLVIPRTVDEDRAWAHLPGSELERLWETFHPDALLLVFLTSEATAADVTSLLPAEWDVAENLAVVIRPFNVATQVGPAFYSNSLFLATSYWPVGMNLEYAHYALPYAAPGTFVRGAPPQNPSILLAKTRPDNEVRGFY